MNGPTSPYAVLGVAEGAGVEICADAFRRALADGGPPLVGALAEERPADLQRWAMLVAAWRAVTPRAG